MILKLFYKPARSAPMLEVSKLTLSPSGIEGAVPTAPMRHLLLVPSSTIETFALRPGDLRENVVVDDSRMPAPLHALPSGTLLVVNGVHVRITVHCEPCGRLSRVVQKPRELEHRRGVLGMILSEGVIRAGDSIRNLGKRFETIPYDLKMRIAWYLRKQVEPVDVRKLVYDIGLSSSYCRAVPRLVRELPEAHAKIRFGVA